MEGIFIPNPPQDDNLNEAVKEEEESKLVTTVEELASAMLRLALEFGEKGFLQRQFILLLRKIMREITGGEQPQPVGAAAHSAEPGLENVCPHPDHYSRQEIPGGAEVNEVSPDRMQASPRMQSPSRLGAIKKVPATVHKMERQIPATPMNVTFILPGGGTTGRKYTYADLSPPPPGAQDYSDATNSGEWVAQPGAIIPVRMTPVNPAMNNGNCCQCIRQSPKQNLYGKTSGSSPMNDSYYCQPLPQTPARSPRTATGRKSSPRRPSPRSTSHCGSCGRR